MLNETHSLTPKLVSKISEIHYRPTEDYVLYTTVNATPIYLGSDNIDLKFHILAHFQYLIKGKSELSDYQYIDLRWKKQIIAKERFS